MLHACLRLSTIIVTLAALGAASAQGAEPSPAATFGSALAAAWEADELACPQGSYDWFRATPETLFCFRVGKSGLTVRSVIDADLAKRGTWLDGWRRETDDIVSRPFWWDGELFRIVIASSFAAPRLAVVFVRHSPLDYAEGSRDERLDQP